jgi:restriction system protein
MWEVRISHPGLNKFRVVKAANRRDAEAKAAMQLRAWDEQWQRLQQAQARREQREAADNKKEIGEQEAEGRTHEVEQEIAALNNLLRDGLGHVYRADWSQFKDHSTYPVPEPPNPQPISAPIEPRREAFSGGLNWFTRLIPTIREKGMAEAEREFRAAYSEWQAAMTDVARRNEVRLAQYQRELEDWNTAKRAWLEDQTRRNAAVDEKQSAYMRCEPQAVSEFCETVLNESEYPETFPSGFRLEYIGHTRQLVVDYWLPSIKAIPNAKSYRYVATKDEIQSIEVSESWRNKTYDSVLYQISLRTLYELFQSDEAGALDSVVF